MAGEPLDFYTRHEYLVEIDGIERAGFLTMSELAVEVTVATLMEGGRAIPHKRPVKKNYPNVTLGRGATDDRDIYDWMEQVSKASTGTGLNENQYKRNIDVVQRDRDGSERRRWTLYGCFPVRFVAGDWDADSDDPLIESVELAYDYFEIG